MSNVVPAPLNGLCSTRNYLLVDVKTFASFSFPLSSLLSYKPFFLMFLILFLTEASAGGAETGRQRFWSRLCADSSEPNMGFELMNINITTWTEADAHVTKPPRRPPPSTLNAQTSYQIYIFYNWVYNWKISKAKGDFSIKSKALSYLKEAIGLLFPNPSPAILRGSTWRENANFPIWPLGL